MLAGASRRPFNISMKGKFHGNLLEGEISLWISTELEIKVRFVNFNPYLVENFYVITSVYCLVFLIRVPLPLIISLGLEMDLKRIFPI